jgi:glycosyltransferase involved in cell wall biosynthesis
VKFAVATHHVPHPQGSAAGRQLWALADALRADGHELEGYCWGPGGATLEVPDWCLWSPQRGPQGRLAWLQTLVKPRSGSARGGWRPADDDAIRWADDWASWPAVQQAGGRSLLTVHYDVGLDARELGWSPGRVQDWRAQRRATRRADTMVALSERVAAAVGTTTIVPATLPMPADALPLREEPVALMFADWSWAPNRAALQQLLTVWPTVRSRVPGAELVVAGRGSPDVASGGGVRVLGTVAATVDAMSEAAVLAFPAPATSGPKMKVLDALGAGLPVVTTNAGVEGLTVPADAVAVTTDTASYLELLVEVLGDPGRRAQMADKARGAVLAHHAPAVAARARVAALVSR